MDPTARVVYHRALMAIMGRHYWIGIGLFLVGAALMALPAGAYKIWTSIAGVTVLLAAMGFMCLEFVRLKRSRGLHLTGRNKILLVAGLVAFVIGILVGVFLAVKFSTGL